jgi:ribosome maturation factor RimP
MIDVDTIVQSVEPAVSALGLELYDVEVSGSGRARVLRILVDRDGGIDLEGIAAATAAASPLLDTPALEADRSGPTPSRSAAPAWSARAPRRTSPGRGGHVSGEGAPPTTSRRRVPRAWSSSASDTGFDLVLDDGTPTHPVRRRRAGPHRVRVGTPAERAQVDRASQVHEVQLGIPLHREPVRP